MHLHVKRSASHWGVGFEPTGQSSSLSNILVFLPLCTDSLALLNSGPTQVTANDPRGSTAAAHGKRIKANRSS